MPSEPLQRSEFATHEVVARFAPGRAADVDPAERRARLEPRGHVHGVAEHVELADHATAHVARDDRPRVDPDHEFERRREIAGVFAQQVAHLERCAHGGARRVGVRHGMSEDGHQRVAQIVVDGTSVPARDAVDQLQRSAHR
jgi:hypothetical protein